MTNYTTLSIYLGLLNILFYLIIRAYHYLVSSDKNRDERQYQQVITLKIISDAFIFVVFGIFVLFGGISVIGKMIDFFAKAIGLDKAVTMEESFVVNFIILFANIGIIFMNDIHKDFFKQIEKMRNDVVIK